MVKLTPPPAGVQDKQVYDYLYQLQEYLALVLDGVQDPGGAVVAASQTAAKAAGKAASAEIVQQVQYLKALIIKTADEVESHTAIDLSGLRDLIDQLGDVIEGDDGLRVQLLAIQNEYLAKSEFGTYQEAIATTLTAMADAIEQRINYLSELASNTDTDFRNWLVESSGYIRSGIVGYREDTSPIIGIAIGQNLKVLVDDQTGEETVVTIDGVDYRVIRQEGFRAIYAADELSFWQDDVKVAHMNNQMLYITDVVALSSLTLGEWRVSTFPVSRGMTIKWIGG